VRSISIPTVGIIRSPIRASLKKALIERAFGADGILHLVATAIGAATTKARNGQEAAGQDSVRLFAPGTATIALRSRRKASSFRIILLLVSDAMEAG
jgi:hypothetical protein